MHVLRLGPADAALARSAVALLVEVFEEPDAEPLPDGWLDALLGRPDVLVLAAVGPDGRTPLGCLTAHALPLTRRPAPEVLVYDVAVAPQARRRGAGRALLDGARDWARSLRAAAVVVPADDEDVEAHAFYRACGGTGSPVTFWTWDGDEEGDGAGGA